MKSSHQESGGAPIQHRSRLSLVAFLLNHGAPLILSSLLLYVLWWGHSPELPDVDAAMRHVSWVGVIALLYVAWQARSVLAQPRGGAMHTMIEILFSLLPLFVVIYAFVDWMRGTNALSIFEVIVMVQATLATLIDVVIFSWFSVSLTRLSAHTIDIQ
ncbi:hypothetical protein Barb4_03787 [Bacteroidales bacterium Barb4]|nr:hypothetical protein Barb4_03787 [Bacteroidales bacterium Barb4]